MIQIEERKTVKLPGETSLFVNFEYDPLIVDAVKQCSVAHYDKNTLTWEVPLTSLSFLIEHLSSLDDLELFFLEDTPLEADRIFELSTYKTTPYQYQLEGIQYGLNHDKWLLLDAPGLGKTLQLIYLAQELKEREGLEHCLIVCGLNTLKNNWKDEIHKHSDLSCMILGERFQPRKKSIRNGSVQERLEDLKNPIEEFFVVTNIQTIRDSNIVSAIKNGPNKFDMIVVDEIHTCVSGDTLINTDRGLIKIKCINQNDNVLSYNVVSNSLEYKKVLNTFKIPNSKKLLKLTILDDNGFEHSIKCTPEHKIYTHNRGFVEAQFLTCDDRIEIIKN